VVVSDLGVFGLMLVVGAIIGAISWFGRRRNIGEARFDTKSEEQKNDD
jgi:hypothetical protein